jgi:hypothetical protein
MFSLTQHIIVSCTFYFVVTYFRLTPAKIVAFYASLENLDKWCLLALIVGVIPVLSDFNKLLNLILCVAFSLIDISLMLLLYHHEVLWTRMSHFSYCLSEGLLNPDEENEERMDIMLRLVRSSFPFEYGFIPGNFLAVIIGAGSCFAKVGVLVYLDAEIYYIRYSLIVTIFITIYLHLHSVLLVAPIHRQPCSLQALWDIMKPGSFPS